MKIFFNNSCSICRSEINVYKKQGIKQLEWVDITNNKDAERDTQKTNKDLKIPLTQSSRNEQLDKIFYMKGSGHLELFRAAFYTFKKNYLFGHGMKNFHNECRQLQLEYKKKVLQ